MDNGGFNYKLPKLPAKNGVSLTRSTMSSNFALVPNTTVNGHRYSSIEVNSGSSGSSDLSTNSSGCEIRTRNRHAIQRQGNVSINPYNRWTVNSFETSNKYYDNKKGIDTSSSANDTNNIYAIADKSKWTHKTPINGNISVNTSAHSNGWAGFHQTKPFLDNASNGSKLWLSDSNKPFYRYNTDRNHHEVNKHTKQLSGDHRIRITVNGGDEHRSSFSGDQNQNYNEESESGASVTIVEIDDVQQSNDDTNTPHIIKNTLHVTPPRYINSSVKRYNEKPIDVPEDFERKAYEFRRNELSPFVRNLQPNSQRQRKNSPAPRIPIKTPKENTTETMGNGCSKNVRRLNKNTVAPNHVASTSTTPIIAHYAEPIKLHSTHSLANKSINEVTPSTSTSTSSNRRVQNTTPRLELYHTHIEKTDARNTQSSSNFDSEAFNLASCIDTKSIIFDKSETKATKPLCVRSSSVDSSSNKSVQRSEVNKFTAHLHRLFRSNQNLASSPTANATAKNEANVSFPKLYRRFSGSVQSLFNSNLNNNRKRNLSASDTNLNRINRCAMTQQQLIDNDYCPSVLYNRKARKSYSEKNLEKTQTFSRWKNQLWLKFSRKRTDPSVPKS